MFEKIVLRRSDTGLALTLGEVAEALLFYQNVHLVLDPSSLQSLGQSLGLQELLALIARKRLTAVYAEDTIMCQTRIMGGIPRHNFNTVVPAGRINELAKKTRRERLQIQLEKLTTSRGEARRYADKFMDLIQIKRYAGDYFAPEGIHKSATADMTDATYVTEAIRRVLQNEVGFEHFADNLRVDVIHLEGQFVVQSNINFEIGNARRAALSPPLGQLTESIFLLMLFDANADVNIASFYGGDFYTSPMNSEIAQIRFAELLRRTGISMKHLQQFKNIVLADYPSIREVINSKERSFGEFERLLDQSDRWHRNINKMGPDTNLVSEYFKQVTHEGWVSSLPAKIIRYVIGLGIEGALNPIAKGAWSIADTLLIDKLKGWRPNHFVDEKLKPFLDKDR